MKVSEQIKQGHLILRVTGMHPTRHRLVRRIGVENDILRLIELAEAKIESTWVSIHDKLPPHEVPLLVCTFNQVIAGILLTEHPGFEDTFLAFDYFVNTSDDEIEWHTVTHWMLAPANANANINLGGAYHV